MVAQTPKNTQKTNLFSYFRGPFFLHALNGPYFLVDVFS